MKFSVFFVLVCLFSAVVSANFKPVVPNWGHNGFYEYARTNGDLGWMLFRFTGEGSIGWKIKIGENSGQIHYKHFRHDGALVGMGFDLKVRNGTVVCDVMKEHPINQLPCSEGAVYRGLVAYQVPGSTNKAEMMISDWWQSCDFSEYMWWPISNQNFTFFTDPYSGNPQLVCAGNVDVVSCLKNSDIPNGYAWFESRATWNDEDVIQQLSIPPICAVKFVG